MTFEQRFGSQPKDTLAALIWAAQDQGWDAGCASERERWRKIIENMALHHTGAVQAALWGIAEMMDRNVTHVTVTTARGGTP